MKNGKLLELEVRELLDAALPASTLSGVCLFQPDLFVEGRNFGAEIDHLLHFKSENSDHLLLIECKALPVIFRGAMPNQANQEWVVERTNLVGNPKTTFLKSQLFAQAQALLQNLYPRMRAESVQLHGIIVSNATATPSLTQKSPSQDRLTYHLLSLDNLRVLINHPADLAALLGANPTHLHPQRVQQSDILRKVRHGLIVPELGHPELPNGLRYVARCREIIDCELTRYFDPKKEGRWAINGGAGMGKTVLLAYAATVFASGKIIQEKLADRQLPKRELSTWGQPTIEENLPDIGPRRVVLIGLNPKQCEVLTKECARFEHEFKHIAKQMEDPQLATIPQLPIVIQWQDHAEIRADVLLVDEAHDLSPKAQTKIREWWEKGKGRRYLILACDRHQKLRLLGDHATILEGLSFAGCSTRLTRNYRSPSPIYGAALALMFRWFGQGGVKILPTQTDLVNHFGFVFDKDKPLPSKAAEPVVLSLKNDSHPANYWSFTVARYADWEVAYHWIEEWGLHSQDVLWVRFSHTDIYLDQQRLDRVQLRDLLVHNPDQVIDTHIKGREFPVVVIEGLPSEGVDQSNLAAMLLWRRRLYLCASRATCFLFFVYPRPDGSPASAAWDAELRALLGSCSSPSNPQQSSSKFWNLRFDFPEQLLRPDVFVDLESPTAPPIADGRLAPPPETDAAPKDAQQPKPPSISTRQPEVSPPSTSPTQAPVQPIATASTQVPSVVEAKSKVAPSISGPSSTPPVGLRVLGAPAPGLMSEKEFQPLYGHVKGWKQDFLRYRQTGNLPTYRPAVSAPQQKPSTQTKSSVADPVQETPPTHTPPPKPAPLTDRKPVPMTPRMISSDLGLLLHKVNRTAMDVLARRKMQAPLLPDLDLRPEIVGDIYQIHGKVVPSLIEAQAIRNRVRKAGS